MEIAKDYAAGAKAEAYRSGDPGAAFDEIWCVFDRDDHERFQDACTMARDNGLRLAVSNPCFELWLLLHFRDSPGAQHRDQVARALRECLRGYRKHLDFAAVAAGVDDAVGRARRLDEDAERMGEPGHNPTTGVYLLVQSIGRAETRDR